MLIVLSTVAQNYSSEVEARIKAVENNLLLGPWEAEGEPGAKVEERMKYYGIKGLSIAVINDFKIEWAKGYGLADSAENRKVTTETMFEPGSISKSLNAMAVLKLVQEKKLSLDTDINVYLKSWKFPYDKKSGGKKITLAHLLSHSAGLSVHGFPGYFYGDTFPSVQQILDGKKPANTEAVRSEFEPGKKYQYSGGGTMISQLMLMDVTGRNYAEFMDETVFKPLEMNNSSFRQPPAVERRKQLATGYTDRGLEVKGKHPILIEQGAGGYWGTPTDLCKFIIELMRSYKGESNKVLLQETVRKMMTAYVSDVGMDLGLGVFLPKANGAKYFSHGAGNQGFRGWYIAGLESGQGVAIFINGERGQIMNEVIGSVAKVYDWKDMARSQKRKFIPVPDSIIARYCGTYRAEEVIASIVASPAGFYYLTGVNRWNMYFTSDTTFFNRESGSDKYMVRDGKGGYKMERWVNGKKVSTADKVTLVPVTPKMTELYTGNYMIDQPISIVKDGNDLYFTFENNKWRMYFLSETEFYMDEKLNTVFKFKIKGKTAIGFVGKGENPAAAERIK